MEVNVMNEYSFESYFVEVNDQVLRVECENEKEYYNLLIDTYDDPYKIYFSGKCPPDEERFRKILFDYLEKQYPGYF